MPTPVPTIPVFPWWYVLIFRAVNALVRECEGAEGAYNIRDVSIFWGTIFFGLSCGASLLFDEYDSPLPTFIYSVVTIMLAGLAVGMHVRAKRLAQ